MSLEEALKANTAALEANSALLKQVIGMAPASGGSASTSNTSNDNDGDEDETALRAEYEEVFGKKAGRMKPENMRSAIDEELAKRAGGAISFDGLKGALAGWLGEFSKAEDKENPDGTHPEVTARREALRKVLGSESVLNSGSAKLTDLQGDDMADKRQVVHNWLEEKAKKIDRGFGIGRLVADPEPADDSSDDDGLGI